MMKVGLSVFMIWQFLRAVWHGESDSFFLQMFSSVLRFLVMFALLMISISAAKMASAFL